ncbi:MAG: hypothetical protein ACWGNI_09860, partial [Desulfobacterales bacterium]
DQTDVPNKNVHIKMIHTGIDFIRGMVFLLLMSWSFVFKTLGKILNLSIQRLNGHKPINQSTI